ncbi:hypothetical protein [Dyadobacter sp. CY356]|uniref:plasmid mobilization protein n=1 Tax=Dyadobacter sp. CY356 TaxID=2906442 RepID=UPI001F42B97B|nr:hypothetical protein [Dyadobacter sp. CY356]MCF0055183.1 hypothetical protein [Dyadobacter sp. CY356]
MKPRIKRREIRVELDDAEWEALHNQLQKSTSRSRSEYLRRKIFGKTLTLKYRNASLDECTEQLTELKEHLKTAAYDFDSAMQKLRNLSSVKDIEHWLISYDLDRRNLLRHVENISNYLQKFSAYDWHNQ